MASSQQLVLAFFDNEAAADQAVEALKQWDRANDDIKLGAVGILVKDENGKIKTHKVGKRAAGKGSKTFAVLGALAGALSGGLSLVGGLVGGAILGGIMGAFFHVGLGISQHDLERIERELDNNGAAVGIVAPNVEVAGLTAKLAELGGRPEAHAMTDEAVAQTTAVAEQMETTVEPAPPEPEAEQPAAA